MKKEVYSLVLSKNVISAIDREANALGISRSNLINQILARHVNYETPEQRMQNIFSHLEGLLEGDTFFPVPQPSESMFSVRTALDFKYNPTLRYSVELYRDSLPILGKLKAVMRTQNPALIQALNSFFTFWNGLERNAGLPMANVAAGRYERLLILDNTLAITTEAAGELIKNYILTLDKALKTYFYSQEPSDAVYAIFQSYITSSIII
jgi:hypothetical protein